MFGPARVGKAVHRVAEFLTGTNHLCHALGQRHRERTTHALATIAMHHHAPGTGAHAVRAVHHTTFKAHPEVGVSRLPCAACPRACARDRLFVPEGLVGDAACHDLRRDFRRGEIPTNHRYGGGHLHGIAGTHGHTVRSHHPPNLDSSEYLRPVPDRSPVLAPAFVAGRLWLDFVNTDDARLGQRHDLLATFSAFVDWLAAAQVIDAERSTVLRRRAVEQPSGAAAALVEAQRIRALLRQLAEHGRDARGALQRDYVVDEINRVLGRSVGTRRVDATPEGGYVRSFVPVGDAFGGLVVPVVESAVDSLVRGELGKVRRCADRRCPRYFADDTKNGTRRWCEMKTCGNRAKAKTHRGRKTSAVPRPPSSRTITP
jgi:predicted RNA-binding Zn ribbon-like protein